MKKTIVVIVALLIVLCMRSSFAISTNSNIKTISFATDIRRLVVLQNNFNDTNDPVEKYYYTQAMIDYVQSMEKRLESVNDIYYKTAILIMTGEITLPSRNRSGYLEPNSIGP